MAEPYFPLFVDLSRSRVVVIGGGSVAERRVRTLRQFCGQIRIISPEITEGLRGLLSDAVVWERRRVTCAEAGPGCPGAVRAGAVRGDTGSADPEGADRENADNGNTFSVSAQSGSADLVLLCTDDRALNHALAMRCREAGIPCNNCSCRADSSFWFPAVVRAGDLVIGLAGNGENHAAVRDAAAKIRNIRFERQEKEGGEHQ